MPQIRYAEDKDGQRLKALWKLAFNDDDGFIARYFNTLQQPDRLMLLEDGGETVSELGMWPRRLCLEGQKPRACAYIYGLATQPEKRGRGYGTALMKEAVKRLFEQGMEYIALYPAGEALKQFYLKLGFRNCLYNSQSVISREQIGKPRSDCRLLQATPVRYNYLRETLLGEAAHIQFDNRDMERQKYLSREAGADIFELLIGGAFGCAAAEYVSEREVIIKELLMPEKFLPEGLALLAKRLPAESYTVRTPVISDFTLGGEPRPFGMLLSRVQEELELSGYMGLAFD